MKYEWAKKNSIQFKFIYSMASFKSMLKDGWNLTNTVYECGKIFILGIQTQYKK